MSEAKLHQKHMDELPAAEFGWRWLGDTGRAHGADRGDMIQLPKQGGIATAWRGLDLTSYFVTMRDPYNWTDIHCCDVMSSSTSEVGMQIHESDMHAACFGEAWIADLITRRDVDIVDVNGNEHGATVCSAWRGRKLMGYYLHLPDPGGRTLLFLHETPQT